MVIDALVLWCLFSLSYFIGFLYGRKGLTPDEQRLVKSPIVKFLSRRERVGVVKTPTPQQIAENQNPLVKGAKDAMREVLSNIPELNA
jgi:hypothetical protein